MPPKRKRLPTGINGLDDSSNDPQDCTLNGGSSSSSTTRPATHQTPSYSPIPPDNTTQKRRYTSYEASTKSTKPKTGPVDGYTSSRFFPSTASMGASGLVAPEIQYHTPHTHQPGHPPTLLRPSQPRPGPEHRPPPTITPVPLPRTPSLSNQPPADRPLQPPQSANRNIDKVVLGDLCFRTWYPSYYGKELLDLGGAKPKDESGRKDQHPVLSMLYVCQHCFKYSKELLTWGGHVRVCGRKDEVPGRKVYVHPRGVRTIQVAQPQSASGGPGKRKRGEGGMKYVEETTKDEGEWSIWEVDGENERLFCQNLSLFAKLFLDNKSVFFDVTGFNYFLLVYTLPPAKLPSGAPDLDASPPRSQIIGFFSKEKMSWDNNNLACILIFPPWQRKGLGSLLMGASYEISRREQILGGPEKPISALGMKGFKRLWASEIARWWLSLHEGDVVDIKDCSAVTWIAYDDILATMREMGVLEDTERGPPKPADLQMVNGVGGEEVQEVEIRDVRRVKVDKERVRGYVRENRLNLESTFDAQGFVEGYAVKSEDEDSEEVMSEA